MLSIFSDMVTFDASATKNLHGQEDHGKTPQKYSKLSTPHLTTKRQILHPQPTQAYQMAGWLAGWLTAGWLGGWLAGGSMGEGGKREGLGLVGGDPICTIEQA